MIKEFASGLNKNSPESIYFRINYDKQNIFFSMRDKESNDVNYFMDYDTFEKLYDSFKTVMDSLPEK